MAEKGEIWYLKLGKRTYRDEKLRGIMKETKSSDFFVIWIAFLCLAICEKRDGSLYISSKKPYTPELLANEIGFPLPRVEEAIRIFEEYDLITIRDGVIWLNKWDKYQSVKTDEEYKKKKADYMKNWRDGKVGNKNKPKAQAPPEPDTGSEWYAPGEAQEIQREQSELLDLAEEIRLVENDRDRRKLIELYADYGREVLRYALNEAADHKAISFAYVTKVCKDYGKEKPKAKDDPSNEYYRDERIEDWN